MRTIQETIDYAKLKHQGQFRFDGVTPYFNHVFDVYDRVAEKGGSIYHQQVALLHDVIEDTDTTATDLLEYGFDKDAVDAVVVLTKKDSQLYDQYLEEVRRNKLARFVKICDMLSNLSDSPSRKQVKKYSSGLFYLIEL